MLYNSILNSEEAMEHLSTMQSTVDEALVSVKYMLKEYPPIAGRVYALKIINTTRVDGSIKLSSYLQVVDTLDGDRAAGMPINPF